jgi:ABC-type nitrate/sulfonate/bicarbonate transport system ATPase subunit
MATGGILFVTHDIEEVVQLAGRVLVMTRRPGSCRADVAIGLPCPRALGAPEYLRARDRTFDGMGRNPHTGMIR